tara:strand:+ start:7712 stop:8554 length:843 start_codon:yes stop_codon:yes gene_type:complete
MIEIIILLLLIASSVYTYFYYYDNKKLCSEIKCDYNLINLSEINSKVIGNKDRCCQREDKSSVITIDFNNNTYLYDFSAFTNTHIERMKQIIASKKNINIKDITITSDYNINSSYNSFENSEENYEDNTEFNFFIFSKKQKINISLEEVKDIVLNLLKNYSNLSYIDISTDKIRIKIDEEPYEFLTEKIYFECNNDNDCYTSDTTENMYCYENSCYTFEELSKDADKCYNQGICDEGIDCEENIDCYSYNVPGINGECLGFGKCSGPSVVEIEEMLDEIN